MLIYTSQNVWKLFFMTIFCFLQQKILKTDFYFLFLKIENRVFFI